MDDAKTAASLPSQSVAPSAHESHVMVSSHSAVPPMARYVQAPTSARQVISFRYDVMKEARLIENLEHNQGALLPVPDTTGNI
jgi:hypothetical protein